MSFDPVRVQDAISSIQAMTSARDIRPPLRLNERTAITALYRAYGHDAEGALAASDDELCVMYASARKTTNAGRIVADRIQAKYVRNPLFDPAEPINPVAPVPTPAGGWPGPANDPANQMTPAPDLSKYATRDYVRDYVEGAQKDIDGQIEQLARNTTDTCLKLANAIEGAVQAQVTEALRSHKPTHLIVQATPTAAPVALGLVHYATAELIDMLAARINVYLHGPAGSGKTTAGLKCATALGVSFYFAAKVESEYMLLGFKDARGETVRTQFREAYEHGGVFLFDELDGSSPSAVVALNAALANGICPFPDGIIAKHDDFYCIAAGNTKLSGASREYVGRNQLDAASVDRFAFLEWNYDEALERSLASDANWCKYVQAARKAVAERALKHLVTPRATLDGCKLLARGMAPDKVARAVVWKGLDADTVRQLEGAMNYLYTAPVAPTVSIL